MRTGLTMLILWFISLPVFSQKKNAAYSIHIHRVSGAIQVDGVLDEPSWSQAEVAENFYMILPMDTSFAKVTTGVRVAYSSDFLYLSAVCYDGKPGPDMVESLRRDLELFSV